MNRAINLAFDKKSPKLEHSRFDTPSIGWVDALRKKYPDIWDCSGSGIADDSFDMWKAYDSGHRSDSVNRWLLRREEWATRHFNDGASLIGKPTSAVLAKQVINMLKWGVVGKIGLDAMIAVVSDLIEGNFTNNTISFTKTFSDYPESAIENAKKADAWKEGHADRKVDRIWELNQKYINNQKFTISDLKLIASFEVHKKHAGENYDSSVESVLWDAVGGTNGVMWARRSLHKLNEKSLSQASDYKPSNEKTNHKCRTCHSYVEGYCNQKSLLVMPSYNCDDWAEYKELGKSNFFSSSPSERIEKKKNPEQDSKHILNVEETEDSYIVEFEKPDSTEENLVDGEKISVPGYIRSNAKKGLSLLEYAGGGLTSKTKAEARQLAAGNASENKIVRMNAWFQRHVSDLSSSDANAYLSGSSDRPTAGQVAWLLWGGDLGSSNRMRAQKWAESKVNSFEEGESSYHSEDEDKHVSFLHNGKQVFGSLQNDDLELIYKSESGNFFKTGAKLNLVDQVYDEVDLHTRGFAKQWNSQAPITDTKAFKEITDSNGAVVDYKDVTFRGYASTNEDVTKGDRIGDYLKKGAFKKTISNFMRNPVMLLDHQNSVKEIAGTYTNLKEDRNGLWVEGKISNSPDLRNIRFLVAEGHLKTLSIGGMFLYGEDGKAIEEVNLFEISLVAIPMNPDAIVSVRNVDKEYFFKNLQK